MNRVHQPGMDRNASSSGFKNLKHKAGVTVRDTKNEVNSAMAIVSVRGMNSSLAIPTTKRIGRKTTTVVTVEARIGTATSRAACTIASHRDCPVLR